MKNGQRPSPALVVSALALFVALGGTELRGVRGERRHSVKNTAPS